MKPTMKTALILALTGGSYAPFAMGEEVSDPLLETAERMNKVGWKLFEEASKIPDIVESDENKNGMILSPVSAYYAFGLLANGAQGDSLSELATLLADNIKFNEENFESAVLERLNYDLESFHAYLKKSVGKAELISLANKVWTNSNTVTLVENYKDRVTSAFDSLNGEELVVSTAFEPKEIASTINTWASKATEKMIPEVVTADDFDSKEEPPAFVLINALVYQGKWAAYDGYDLRKAKDATEEEKKNQYFNFSNKNKTHSQVDVVEGTTTLYASQGGYEAITIPTASIVEKDTGKFEKGRYTVDLIRVPQDKTNRISYTTYGTLVRKLNKSADNPDAPLVDWEIPKISVKSKIDLIPTLINGYQINTLFDRDFASFGGMVTPKLNEPNPFVKFARQDAALDLDDKGISAAATTVIGGAAVSGVFPDKLKFKINSPYFIAIRDTMTNAVLFMAAIDNL